MSDKGAEQHTPTRLCTYSQVRSRLRPFWNCSLCSLSPEAKKSGSRSPNTLPDGPPMSGAQPVRSPPFPESCLLVSSHPQKDEGVT